MKPKLLIVTLFITQLFACTSGTNYTAKECTNSFTTQYRDKYKKKNNYFFTEIYDTTIMLQPTEKGVILTSMIKQSDHQRYQLVSEIDIESPNVIKNYYKGPMETPIVETTEIIRDLNTYDGLEILLKDLKTVTQCQDFVKDIKVNSSTDISEILDVISPKLLTYNSSFNFDNLDITFSSDIVWSKISNKYSEFYGHSTALVPVTIANNGVNSNILNIMYYKIFGPNGTQLDDMDYYFSNSTTMSGFIRPAGVLEAYFPILYDGDGTYVIQFDNRNEYYEVIIEIKK